VPDPDPEIEALNQRYARNREWAKRGSYQTRLSPAEEKEFHGWLYKNAVPFDPHWPPDQSMQDYDMRGFYKAMKKGDPLAKQDPGSLHFPDKWKTPYHETFSNQSMYATPDAPQWKGGALVDKQGNVIWSPDAQRQ
jgi:hypothetical protein